MRQEFVDKVMLIIISLICLGLVFVLSISMDYSTNLEHNINSTLKDVYATTQR